MIFALLTAFCWSLSGFASSRISRSFGARPANLYRLTIASFLLAGICIGIAAPFLIKNAQWVILAGLSHLAIGDLALFAAFRRIGPRIGILLVGSLAPPVSLFSEWLFLDTQLKPLQYVCAFGILTLVAIAIAPAERQHLPPRELRLGILFGVIAALGQGLGSTLQRMGSIAVDPSFQNAWTLAFLRVSAGAAGVGMVILWAWLRGKKPFAKPTEIVPYYRVKGYPAVWLSISILFGPLIGMLCFVTALSYAPAALVQAIIATMPVFMIPIAWAFDGNKPSFRSVISGCGAVGLTACLVSM